MKAIRIFAALVAVVLLSSCSYRVLDFTVVSSKALQVGVDKTNGKVVEGSSMGFLGFGSSIKSAVDEAIEKGGTGCDMLVDGVIFVKDAVFVSGYKVKGTAINSKVLRAELGAEGWKQFCQEHNMKLVDENGEEVAMK